MGRMGPMWGHRIHRPVVFSWHIFSALAPGRLRADRLRKSWVCHFAIADIISSATNNPNVFQGGVDQVSMYKKVLTQSEITALYNSGTPITGTDASVTTNLLGEYRLENNGNDSSSGAFPNLTNNGGTFTTY